MSTGESCAACSSKVWCYLVYSHEVTEAVGFFENDENNPHQIPFFKLMYAITSYVVKTQIVHLESKLFTSIVSPKHPTPK